jgi:hypothetical protein
MLRITIRDVLWLTVLAAVCCAWHLDHVNLKHAIGFLGLGAAKVHLIKRRLDIDDEGMNEFIEALGQPSASIVDGSFGQNKSPQPSESASP